MTTNLLQFVYGATVSKRAAVTPAWRQWGPFWIIAAASLASMADISRQIILDSKNAVLILPDGSSQEFKFDSCQYSATATPLIAEAASLCPVGALNVRQQGAVTPGVDRFLQSALFAQVCHYLNWLGVLLTIVGFMWLSDVVPWLRNKWYQKHSCSLTQNFLNAEAPQVDSTERDRA